MKSFVYTLAMSFEVRQMLFKNRVNGGRTVGGPGEELRGSVPYRTGAREGFDVVERAREPKVGQLACEECVCRLVRRLRILR